MIPDVKIMVQLTEDDGGTLRMLSLVEVYRSTGSVEVQAQEENTERLACQCVRAAFRKMEERQTKEKEGVPSE